MWASTPSAVSSFDRSSIPCDQRPCQPWSRYTWPRRGVVDWMRTTSIGVDGDETQPTAPGNRIREVKMTATAFTGCSSYTHRVTLSGRAAGPSSRRGFAARDLGVGNRSTLRSLRTEFVRDDRVT